MNRIGRKIVVGFAAVAVAGGGYAFLASNTVAASLAGSGEATVSGYIVSDIHYSIDTGHIGDYSENSANVASVSFKLDSPAATANVSADFVGSYQGQVAKYGNCAQTTGFSDLKHFTCLPDGSEINLSGSVKLVVNAAQ
jgi:hypothetical protein